jgi:hypothetical protein
MEKSKDQFLEMREEEMSLIYRADFTKKNAQAKGKELAEKIIEEGLISKQDAFVNLTRICELLNTAKDVLIESLPKEKFIHLGIEFTPVNGRKMYNFKEDEYHARLTLKIKEREERLKMSANTKDAIFCNITGEEIPKVSVSFAKDSLNLKY